MSEAAISIEATDEVADFERKYEEILDLARESAKMTEEPAWQRMYHQHREQVQKERDIGAKILRNHAESLQRGLLSDDDMKAIKDELKAEDARKAAIFCFERDVLARVKEPEEQARKLLDKMRLQIRQDEENAPLTTRRRLERLKSAMANVTPIRWNQDTGMVSVG